MEKGGGRRRDRGEIGGEKLEHFFDKGRGKAFIKQGKGERG